jgi:hypothetical protein
MQAHEHVLHLKSFHHGGLCVNYLLPALCTAQHHYFRIQHLVDEPVDQHVRRIIEQQPINRMLFPYEVTQSLAESIAESVVLTTDLTIQSTQTLQSADRIDLLFNSGRVKRFVIMFGCGELPAAYLLQDLNQTNWAQKRLQWDHTVFTATPSDFWTYEIFEHGLGLRCSAMTNFHVPGDTFEHLPDGTWHWLGRNTQIKKQGRIIFPAAIETVLKDQFPYHDIMIIPDYQHKRVYAAVFQNRKNQSDSDLLDEFNAVIDQQADPYHRLDLVLTLNKHFINSVPNKAPSVSAARFLARKALGLDTSA